MRILAILASLVLLPAESATAATLAGRWEGFFHGGRADQPVTLICRPGAGGTLGGLLYLDADLVGPLENGTVLGDSLRFRVMNFSFRARRDGDQMALLMTVAHGASHPMSLHFASADTARLVRSPEAVAAGRARVAVAWNEVPDSIFAAHRIAAVDASGASPAMGKGTLFLVGGGPQQSDCSAEFVRLAGGASANVVVIPTAAMEPDGSTDDLKQPDRWARALGVSRPTVVHTTSRKEADSESFVQPLRQATAVWLPGGEAGRILVSYLGTRTERELMALLARGGVIGGTSAGALVWGSECQVFRGRYDASPFQTGDVNALLLDDPHSVCFGALLNVLIAPHFTEFRMQPSLEKTLAARPQLMGIGIDEATAFVIRGGLGSVLGRGHVTIFDGKDHGGTRALTLSAGSRYDLVHKSAL